MPQKARQETANFSFIYWMYFQFPCFLLQFGAQFSSQLTFYLKSRLCHLSELLYRFGFR